jgi:hypothetical protein
MHNMGRRVIFIWTAAGCNTKRREATRYYLSQPESLGLKSAPVDYCIR